MKPFLFALAALVALVLLLAPPPLERIRPADPPGPQDRIPPATIASWILSGERHFLVMDIRPTGRFREGGIRTARSVPADSLDPEAIRALPPGSVLVLYGESDEDVVDPYRRAKAIHEQTYVLAGGYGAWEREALATPEPPTDDREEAWDEYRTRVAAVRFLAGETDVAPEPVGRTVRPVERPATRGTPQGC